MTKRIEIDDELYQFIASHTQHIGESASAILRRLLDLPAIAEPQQDIETVANERKASGRVFDRLTHADLAGQRSIVARFLHILASLQKCHPEQFHRVLEISGRDRQYFSRSRLELEQTGNSTNPKPIPDTDYYVVTNNNTTRKKSILTQVAIMLGYTDAEAERIRDFL